MEAKPPAQALAQHAAGTGHGGRARGCGRAWGALAAYNGGQWVNAGFSPAQITDQAPKDVWFTAPEVIYLTPSTAGEVAMQYFADQRPNDFDNPASYTVDNSNARTDGLIYFYCQNATEAKIECLTSGVTTTLWTGGASSNATSTGDNAGKDVINGINHTNTNKLVYYIGNTATATNSSRMVTWKVTFKVKGNNQEYTNYAYSYIYKPYQGLYGAVIEGKAVRDASGLGVQTSNTNLGMALWMMGAHAVDREDISTTALNYSRPLAKLAYLW